MGNGNGTFQPAKNYPVGANPYSMAIADFASDGITDVVTSNRAGNTVSVLLGNGNGTFAPAETYPTGTTPARSRSVTSPATATWISSPPIRATTRRASFWATATARFPSDRSRPRRLLHWAPFQVVVADLTDNGIPDIVTANRPREQRQRAPGQSRRLIPDQGDLCHRMQVRFRWPWPT